jgi:hypothetical protein
VSNEEIDRVLNGDEAIVPSSGFTSSVMEAVRRDTEAPPPIPFPWKRAVPGFIVCVIAAAVLLFAGGGPHGAVEIHIDAGMGWALVGLLVAALSALVSVRLA